MKAERRKYLRVLFEETIEVHTAEWSDTKASSLDISLNGVRFHCESALSEGEEIKVVFTPEMQFRGIVRWCWPIEWYYQAAIEFIDIGIDTRQVLRNYIIEVTGEDYPEDGAPAPEESEKTKELIEDFAIALGEDLELDDEFIKEPALELDEEEDALFEEPDDDLDDDDLESLTDLDEHALDDGDLLLDDDDEELSEEETVLFDRVAQDLSPRMFEGRHALLIAPEEDSMDAIQTYLQERNGFETRLSHANEDLIALINDCGADVILLHWNTNGSHELLNSFQELYPGIPIIVICGTLGLEQRLSILNAGACDVISVPTLVSSIAQSVLVHIAGFQDLLERVNQDNLGIED